MKIKITADSTCDLPEHILKEHDIHITPLHVVLGEQSYADRLEIGPPQLFAYMAEGKNTCYTAACNVVQYTEAFRQYQHYDAIIHISLSAALSCSHASAIAAAEEFPNVYVVDSANLSVGSGMLAERAAELAAQGLSPAQILDNLNGLSKKLESSFIIDSLEYLKRGGRCSALSQFGANLLQMKVSLEVKDGQLQVGKKYRGNFAKCAKKYLEDRLIGRQDIRPDILYWGSTGCEPELLAEMRAMIAELGYFKRVKEFEAGCVISCHSGPNAIGLFYELK